MTQYLRLILVIAVAVIGAKAQSLPGLGAGESKPPSLPILGDGALLKTLLENPLSSAVPRKARGAGLGAYPYMGYGLGYGMSYGYGCGCGGLGCGGLGCGGLGYGFPYLGYGGFGKFGGLGSPFMRKY